jgi:hypothetical protein
MLSSLKKTNPFSTFPLDLQAIFEELKVTLNIYLELKDGEKIGKNKDNKYYKFSNSYAQVGFRWLYAENREKTVSYLDEDLGEYINFLDRLISKIEDDILGVYKNFGTKVKGYNTELIQGLYVLKETYNNQTLTVSDKTKIVAKIDSIILTLIDFKDKITTAGKQNDKKMDTLLTINNTIRSFEV